jgi:hypothetical protein
MGMGILLLTASQFAILYVFQFVMIVVFVVGGVGNKFVKE